jgi:hypothetical protein
MGRGVPDQSVRQVAPALDGEPKRQKERGLRAPLRMFKREQVTHDLVAADRGLMCGWEFQAETTLASSGSAIKGPERLHRTVARADMRRAGARRTARGMDRRFKSGDDILVEPGVPITAAGLVRLRRYRTPLSRMLVRTRASARGATHPAVRLRAWTFLFRVIAGLDPAIHGAGVTTGPRIKSAGDAVQMNCASSSSTRTTPGRARR